LLLLGAASYAIYLVHHAIVQYAADIAGSLWPHASIVVVIAVATVIFALATLAGIAAHKWVEQPIGRLLKNWRRGRSAAVVAAE
jgi:peptidoglycan/LPS O-acetylase OafA/YrhL